MSPVPFLRGFNNKKAKIHRRNLKIFFSKTTMPSSIKLSLNYPFEKKIEFVFQMKNHALFLRKRITIELKHMDEISKYSP